MILPVYNGQKYLDEAINSVLRQTFGDFEFIIIDDGSNDRSVELLRSYSDSRIKIFSRANKGLAATLNEGISYSKSTYLARMDQDDKSEPERFQRQIDFMENNPRSVGVGTNAKIIDKNGVELYSSHLPTGSEELRKLLPYTNPFFHGSMMLRREAVLSVGGYRTDTRHYVEDDLLWIELAKRGTLNNLEWPLYCQRIHPESMNNLQKAVKKRLRKIVTTYSISGTIEPRDLEFLQGIRNKQTARQKRSTYHLTVGKMKLEYLNDRQGSRKEFIQSFLSDPLNVKAVMNYVTSFFPRNMLLRWVCLRESIMNRSTIRGIGK